ncbi:hypothetical protein [Aquipseudomonas ullengensis]|uniref:Uncharacterized protein n=1 Tax=Aquipseudomonas ullengensis TaxID=2759166 RepID=A0A7W4LMM7_9GAMM|nr:hypothetical protein [Pseudomonas ullengensis]MBB2495949.1 hypothetical protein [Pseudomonas ullengensis]
MDSTIWAAVIAAAIAFLSLVIAKEQKVSEFRQTWIDSLREEVANTISNLILLHSALMRKADGDSVTANDVSPYIASVNVAMSSAHMRLNPADKDGADLIRALEDVENFFNREVANCEELQVLIDSIRPAAKVVLKNEWERVKRGEFIYRCCLGLALVSLALSLIYVGLGSELLSALVR